MQMKTAQLVSAQPTPQQLLDYANAVMAVNAYAYAITNKTLPLLSHPTMNYGRFAEKFVPAKKHALVWSSSIFVSLLAVPEVIKDQAATLFNLEKTLIRAYLQLLIDDPQNAKAKTALADALEALAAAVDAQAIAIGGLEQRLVQFTADLSADAKVLAVIAGEALDDVKEDKEQIVHINAAIASLRTQVDNARTLMTLARIGTGVSLFVGAIGFALIVAELVPLGVATIVVAAVGETASVAGWVIEQKRIDLLENEIQLDQKQIRERTQDIVLLHAINAQFEALVQANEKATQALQTVKSMWRQLAGIVGDVRSDLADTGREVTQAHYRQALADFEKAEDHWSGVVAFAQALAGIDYNWQSADGTWHRYRQQAPAADAGYITQVRHAA